MKKSLLINFLVIILVTALSVGATYAWFSSSDQSNFAEVTTAKVAVNDVTGFSLSFDKLLPGETQSKEIFIQNNGNIKEDFYVQMIYDTEPHLNFCYMNEAFNPVLWLKVSDQWGSVKYDNWICYLYSYNAYGEGMAIPKLADDVPVDAIRSFTLELTLKGTAGDEYMDGYNKDFINIIGTQYNGPAPIPATQMIWPEGDPNY